MEIIDSTFEGHFEVWRTRVFVSRFRRVETRRASRSDFRSEAEVYRDRGIVPERGLRTAPILHGGYFYMPSMSVFDLCLADLVAGRRYLCAAFSDAAPKDRKWRICRACVLVCRREMALSQSNSESCIEE
jgi:hypothetical protein